MSTRLQIPDRRFSLIDLLDWANSLARRKVSGAFSWTPGLIPANDEVTTTLTTATTDQVAGLRTTMAVYVTAPADLDAGLSVTVLAAPASNQLRIRVRNSTGGGITPAAGVWTFKAWQT